MVISTKIVLKLESKANPDYDITSYAVAYKSNWEALLENVSELPSKVFEVYYGVNQFLEFDSPQEALAQISTTYITPTEVMETVLSQQEPKFLYLILRGLNKTYDEFNRHITVKKYEKILLENPEENGKRLIHTNCLFEVLGRTRTHEKEGHPETRFVSIADKAMCEECKTLSAEKMAIRKKIDELDVSIGLTPGAYGYYRRAV